MTERARLYLLEATGKDLEIGPLAVKVIEVLHEVRGADGIRRADAMGTGHFGPLTGERFVFHDHGVAADVLMMALCRRGLRADMKPFIDGVWWVCRHGPSWDARLAAMPEEKPPMGEVHPDLLPLAKAIHSFRGLSVRTAVKGNRQTRTSVLILAAERPDDLRPVIEARPPAWEMFPQAGARGVTFALSWPWQDVTGLDLFLGRLGEQVVQGMTVHTLKCSCGRALDHEPPC